MIYSLSDFTSELCIWKIDSELDECFSLMSNTIGELKLSGNFHVI